MLIKHEAITRSVTGGYSIILQLRELTDASECNLAFLIQHYPRAGHEPVPAMTEFEDDMSHKVLLVFFWGLWKKVSQQ